MKIKMTIEEQIAFMDEIKSECNPPYYLMENWSNNKIIINLYSQAEKIYSLKADKQSADYIEKGVFFADAYVLGFINGIKQLDF